MAIPLRQNQCESCYAENACFTKLPEIQMDLLDSNRVEVKYNKGETICKQGASTSNLIYIRSGLVKLYLEGKSDNLILRILTKGSLLGLASVYSSQIYHYSAVAYEPTEVCLIDIAHFKTVVNNNPEFADSMMKIFSEETIQSYDRFYSLTKKQMNGRLADILLCLSDHVYSSDNFTLTLSRKDLADLAAMSTESVIRILKEFNNDNILKSSAKQIQFLDKKRLRQISDFG